MSNNIFITSTETMHRWHRYKSRKWISLTIKTIALACDLSLQFDCNFINTKKIWILATRKGLTFIKCPLTILSILSTIFIIYKYADEYKKSKSVINSIDKQKLSAELLVEISSLFSDLIYVLITLKVVSTKASTIGLLASILFMVFEQPTRCVLAYMEYSQNKDTKKYRQYMKSLTVDTTTLVLTIWSFYLKNTAKTQDIPIVLSQNVIYVFNLGVVVGMVCTLVSIFSTFDHLLLPSSQIDSPDVPPSPRCNSPETSSEIL